MMKNLTEMQDARVMQGALESVLSPYPQAAAVITSLDTLMASMVQLEGMETDDARRYKNMVRKMSDKIADKESDLEGHAIISHVLHLLRAHVDYMLVSVCHCSCTVWSVGDGVQSLGHWGIIFASRKIAPRSFVLCVLVCVCASMSTSPPSRCSSTATTSWTWDAVARPSQPSPPARRRWPR
jgi:hypothetical protein